MGMVVSAAVTGIPIIEQLEQPYYKTTRAIIEPSPETKPYIPSPSVQAAKKTYSTTRKIPKNDTNYNLKGKKPTNSKKLSRKKQM